MKVLINGIDETKSDKIIVAGGCWHQISGQAHN